MKEYILDYGDLKVTATKCKSYRTDGFIYHVSVYYANELQYAYPTFEDNEWTAINEVLCLYRERDVIPYSDFIISKTISLPCLDSVNSLLDKIHDNWGHFEDMELKIKEVEI